jgi:hypothetical protein
MRRVLRQFSTMHGLRRTIPRVSLPNNNQEIRLTLVEENICHLLDECCRDHASDLQCRIAGGWVRDKVIAQLILSLSSLVDIHLKAPWQGEQ